MDNFSEKEVPSDTEANKELQETPEQIIAQFKKTCRVVRDGCNFDISKCFADGKPLIIDGTHIDP